ncbi:MAG: PqqD family protein [Kiritimatiellae bacterium]|nr:PqqD family protein [Kiritimatiellia bacterium]
MISAESLRAIAWRPMLESRPYPNSAAEVALQPDGTVQIAVKLKKMKWLIPPLSWLIRPGLRRRYHLQDKVAVTIWKLCDGQHSTEAIVDEFAQRYALTFHEARAAVTEYLKTLVQRGIIAVEQHL